MWWVDGLLNLTWGGKLIYTLIVTHITVIAVTLYLHRSACHRGLELHPVVSHFFRLWLWLTTGMNTKQWVAIHRKHHAACETEDDPHSPQILGLKKVLFEGAELFRAEAKVQETLDVYGKGTPEDWIENNVYTPHSVAGIWITLFVNVLLLGPIGITIFAIQMVWIPFWAAGIVNGVGHYFGYRNFECSDAAVNVMPWGIIMGGEELHNNHHTYGSSAKLSFKWWEFDIGWMYICILRFFGLAKVIRTFPKLAQDEQKQQLDTDCLTAIITNRFQVLDQYWHKVVLPVMRSQKIKVNKLVVREASIMSPEQQAKLEKLLAESAVLKTVYEYKQQLQEIWRRTAYKQGEKLEKLRAWCAAAESSGIQCLQDFADSLRHYTAARAQ